MEEKRTCVVFTNDAYGNPTPLGHAVMPPIHASYAASGASTGAGGLEGMLSFDQGIATVTAAGPPDTFIVLVSSDVFTGKVIN